MAIPSPCNSTCVIDEKSGLCYGCARSLDEIMNWSQMESGKRNQIMDEIDDRLAQHFGIARSERS